MNKHLSLVSVVTVLLIVAVASPAVTGAVVLAAGHYSQQLKDAAQENKTALHKYTRELNRINGACSGRSDASTTDPTCKAYWTVTQQCLDRRGIRENIGCPDFHDLPELLYLERKFKREANGDLLSMRPAAGDEVDMSDLSAEERLMLRTNAVVGRCSRKMPNALFHACEDQVEQQTEDVKAGFMNLDAAAKQKVVLPGTLELRLKFLKEAYGK